MDKYGNIYEVPEVDLKDLLPDEVQQRREDVARLEGYLRARAEADEPKRRLMAEIADLR